MGQSLSRASSPCFCTFASQDNKHFRLVGWTPPTAADKSNNPVSKLYSAQNIAYWREIDVYYFFGGTLVSQ